MQVILVLILLGTVDLAQWVVSNAQNIDRAAEKIALGSFAIQMPTDWTLSQRRTPEMIEIIAADPETHRQLTAIYQALDAPIKPMDYLTHVGMLSGPWRGQDIVVGGYPGVYLETTHVIPLGRGLIPVKLLVCIVLPSNEVLTVQLAGLGKVDASDQQVVQRFLKDLRINAPTSQPAKQQQPADWQGV